MFHRLSFVVFTLFFLFASVVRADYPACAMSCLGSASLGSCSSTDNACLCRSGSYCNATNNCFRTTCSAADWKAAYDYSVGLCNAAGVTQSNILNPPPPKAKRDFVPVYYGRAVASA